MASATSPFGRLTHQILDLDYGDEQERLRYYETYAIAIHLQLLVLPVVGAIVIGVAGRAVTGPVLIMLGMALATILPGLIHLGRHNVRTESIAMSERNRGYTVAYAVSCLMLIAAVLARGTGSAFGDAAGIGAAVGLGVWFVAVAVASRRQSCRDDVADFGS